MLLVTEAGAFAEKTFAVVTLVEWFECWMDGLVVIERCITAETELLVVFWCGIWFGLEQHV